MKRWWKIAVADTRYTASWPKGKRWKRQQRKVFERYKEFFEDDITAQYVGEGMSLIVVEKCAATE